MITTYGFGGGGSITTLGFGGNIIVPKPKTGAIPERRVKPRKRLIKRQDEYNFYASIFKRDGEHILSFFSPIIHHNNKWDASFTNSISKKVGENINYKVNIRFDKLMNFNLNSNIKFTGRFKAKLTSALVKTDIEKEQEILVMPVFVHNTKTEYFGGLKIINKQREELLLRQKKKRKLYYLMDNLMED
jgi:hypothetical protein